VPTPRLFEVDLKNSAEDAKTQKKRHLQEKNNRSEAWIHWYVSWGTNRGRAKLQSRDAKGTRREAWLLDGDTYRLPASNSTPEVSRRGQARRSDQPAARTDEIR